MFFNLEQAVVAYQASSARTAPARALAP